MTGLETFLWGLGGSAAVEVVTIYRAVSGDESELHPRYRRKLFWAMRIALLPIAGAAAVIAAAPSPGAAVYAGIAAPVLIEAVFADAKRRYGLGGALPGGPSSPGGEITPPGGTPTLPQAPRGPRALPAGDADSESDAASNAPPAPPRKRPGRGPAGRPSAASR